MSIDTIVILRDDRLPTRDQWQQALEAAGMGIVLDGVDDLRRHSGFLPARFRGTDSGFEWFYGRIGDILGDKPDAAGDRDHAIDFVTHSDLNELICALLAAGVLARLADGLFLDEESGTFVSGDRAIEIALGIEEAERAQKQRLAAMDAGITDRRCPQCGAPCPTYRKTCKACGFDIGRTV